MQMCLALGTALQEAATVVYMAVLIRLQFLVPSSLKFSSRADHVLCLSSWIGECAGENPASIGLGSRDMRPVVICGFGELGQSVVNMLESPLSQTLERGQVPYVAFDLQPSRIKAARAAGFNVLYGSVVSHRGPVHLMLMASKLFGRRRHQALHSLQSQFLLP